MREDGHISLEDEETALSICNQLGGLVANKLAKDLKRLNILMSHPRLAILPLPEPMLERQVSAGAMGLSLKNYLISNKAPQHSNPSERIAGVASLRFVHGQRLGSRSAS